MLAYGSVLQNKEPNHVVLRSLEKLRRAKMKIRAMGSLTGTSFKKQFKQSRIRVGPESGRTSSSVPHSAQDAGYDKSGTAVASSTANTTDGGGNGKPDASFELNQRASPALIPREEAVRGEPPAPGPVGHVRQGFVDHSDSVYDCTLIFFGVLFLFVCRCYKIPDAMCNRHRVLGA